MNIYFVDYFVDPETKEPLELEVAIKSVDDIQSGFFLHNPSGRKYPIVRGIPRFVEYEKDNYSKSFGYQWRRWPRVQFESENIGTPMEGWTRDMWERIVGLRDRNIDLVGKTIVDIGCGPGRFVDVARMAGARVVGIDYSCAVESAGINFANDQKVCICQADALKLPLRTASVDGAFSIGVLHHTPNPKSGVEEAYRVLKADGWFGLCVYGKGTYYDSPSVKLWRRVFKALWPVFGHWPPLLYAYMTTFLFRPVSIAIPPIGPAIRMLFPFVKLADSNWSLLDTFDSVTPSFQSAHESYEVFRWLKEAGFDDIQPSDWGYTSFSGLTSGKGGAL